MEMTPRSLGLALLFGASCLTSPLAGQSSGAVLPVIGSAPETGFQGGIAYLRARQPDDSLGTRPSSRMGNIIYTQRQQFRAFLESDRWTAGNARRHQWGVIAMAYPLPFEGPSVSRSAAPSSIENDLGGRVVANFSEGQVGVPSSGCSSLPCPDVTGPQDYVPEFEHTTLMLSAGHIADTRDHIFAPTAGKYFEITLTGAYNTTASEALSRLRVDWRRISSYDGARWRSKASCRAPGGDPQLIKWS